MVGFLRTRLPSVVLLVGGSMVVLGCGGGNGDGGTPPPTTTIAKTSSNSGDAQSAIVGQALAAPIQVIVRESGVPVSGSTVTWSATTPGAELAATSTTDAAGVASSAWTLGTVSGTQTAQASLSGASGSPVSFTATAAPDVPASIAELSGNQQVGEINSQLASPVQAQVSDQFGNRVPGAAVAWAATGATVSAPVVPTDASGVSGVNVTLGGTAGPVTITATEANLSGSPVTFTATAVEPGPATASVGVINNSFTPSSLTISAGTTVVWTWTSTAMNHNVVPAGTVPPSSGAPADGPRTYSFRFDTPGTYSYFCEVHAPGMSGVITVQ